MRLTKQIDLEELGYDYVLLDETKQPSANYKLGQLEDIEDELGIDLVTLFKLLFSYGPTIYTINGNVFNNSFSRHLINQGAYYIFFYQDTQYKGAIALSDYGKTWALTKEELL